MQVLRCAFSEEKQVVRIAIKLSHLWWVSEVFNIYVKKLIPYRTKFRRTKFSTDKIFRRTKFSTPSRNFDTFVQFLPDFCIEILD